MEIYTCCFENRVNETSQSLALLNLMPLLTGKVCNISPQKEILACTSFHLIGTSALKVKKVKLSSYISLENKAF